MRPFSSTSIELRKEPPCCFSDAVKFYISCDIKMGRMGVLMLEATGGYSLNVNEWKFHSPIEWNSCKPLKKEWFCTLNSKFPLIKSENHSKKSELPLIWGVKRRTTRKRIVLRLTPQTSGNSLFLESFSLYMSGNLLFNVQNHSFLSGLQEFHSFGGWNFHSFTFRE